MYVIFRHEESEIKRLVLKKTTHYGIKQGLFIARNHKLSRQAHFSRTLYSKTSWISHVYFTEFSVDFTLLFYRIYHEFHFIIWKKIT